MLVQFQTLPPFVRHHQYCHPASFEMSRTTTTRFPQIYVSEQGDTLQIVAEVSGVSKDDITVKVEGNTLTIRGERKLSDEFKNVEWLRQEIFYGTFERSVEIPYPVDTNSINARYANGLLHIALQKHENAKPKEIIIQ